MNPDTFFQVLDATYPYALCITAIAFLLDAYFKADEEGES